MMIWVNGLGLAVGVGFGGIGVSSSATFESARSLAIGIGLQNFPEGLAVSLPLLRLGYSPFKSFWCTLPPPFHHTSRCGPFPPISLRVSLLLLGEEGGSEGVGGLEHE